VTSNYALRLITLLLRVEEEGRVTGRMRNLALPADHPEHFPLLSDLVWKHLSDILERPWFRRAWIVQEVAVGRRATLFGGDATVDLDDLLQVMLYLTTRNLQGFFHEGIVNLARLWYLVDNRK
jgi:hypothetical protein